MEISKVGINPLSMLSSRSDSTGILSRNDDKIPHLGGLVPSSA